MTSLLETTQMCKALRTLIEYERERDSDAALTREMDELDAIRSYKLTKREYADARDRNAIRDECLNDPDRICEIAAVVNCYRDARAAFDVIRLENPSCFSRARDRNAVRDECLNDPDRIRAITSGVNCYGDADAALDALVDHHPDGWWICLYFAYADVSEFNENIAKFTS